MKKKTYSVASKSRIYEQRTALTHSLLKRFSEISPTEYPNSIEHLEAGKHRTILQQLPKAERAKLRVALRLR